MKHKQNSKLTVREHLEELRKRLFWVVGIFMLGVIPGLVFSHQITQLLIAPLGQNLFFSTPTGGLNFVMQISLITGLIIAIPVTIFQLAQFARPVSHKIQPSLAVKVLVTSAMLAAVGVWYAYVFSLPASLHFLTNFTGEYIEPLMNAGDYLNFVMTYLIGSALIFQVPLILYFINRIKPLKPGTLKKWQRPVLAGSVIFAGIITPTPDPYNQMMIALPLIVLFEISAAGIWLARKRPSLRPQVTSPTRVPHRSTPQVQPIGSSLDFMPKTATAHVSLASDLAPQSASSNIGKPERPQRPIFRDISPPNTQTAW